MSGMRGHLMKLGGETLNKTAAGKRLSVVLQSAPIGRALQGANAALVGDAFTMHPDAPQKAPHGAAGHLVRQIEYRGGIFQRCFFVVWPDSTEVDWSYRVAIGLAPSGPTFQEAAREAIAPYVQAYKATRYGSADSIGCDLSGDPVKHADAHVDHAPPWPFVEILRAYIRDHGVPAIVGREPWGCDFADAEARDRFLRFHHDRAVLRILDAKLNISRGARS